MIFILSLVAPGILPVPLELPPHLAPSLCPSNLHSPERANSLLFFSQFLVPLPPLLPLAFLL